MLDTKLLTDNGVNLQKSLELFGDMETYNESIKDFQTELKNKIDLIEKYKSTSDLANYAIQVHSLKSDARYFGFEKLGDLAFEHEQKSKANDIYYVSEHYNELKQEAYNAANIVNEYLGVDSPKLEITAATNDKDKSILVVDDSNVISTYLTNIFQNNYNIIIARDGDEAIAKLSDPSLKIKVMLLDLNLPTVNGYEVLNYMKTNGINNVKVAIVTGNDSKTVVEKSKGLNVGVIVEKPFNEASIKSAVERLENPIEKL